MPAFMPLQSLLRKAEMKITLVARYYSFLRLFDVVMTCVRVEKLILKQIQDSMLLLLKSKPLYRNDHDLFLLLKFIVWEMTEVYLNCESLHTQF